MKKNLINETHIEGILYEHSLEKKVTGEKSKNPGTEYIAGTVNIATTDDMMNTVAVRFSYVTPKTSKGKINTNYNVLEDIINGKYKAYVDLEEGESETKFRIDSKIGLNEWYNEEQLISNKVNDGGFIHVTPTLTESPKDRATFKVDMLITATKRVEADEEKKTPEKLMIKGAIFDSFRKTLLPIDFVALNSKAMDYFEGLGASKREPVFTKVWGEQISQTVVTEKVEESAFGEAKVERTSTTRKEYVITGAQKEPYEWDSESTLEAADVSKMMEERETYLATLKQQAIEYKKNPKKKVSSAESVEKVRKDHYDF